MVLVALLTDQDKSNEDGLHLLMRDRKASRPTKIKPNQGKKDNRHGVENIRTDELTSTEPGEGTHAG
jgi:hypothetical protein